MSLQPNAVSDALSYPELKLKLSFLLFWYSGKALSEQSILYHHSGLDKLPMSLLFVAP